MIKKILCWSDSATAGTGFGTVSRHILKALHNTGKYNIHHLAINFHGDFVDKEEVPWQVQPAGLLDPKDPHGMRMFIRTMLKNEYDFIWVLNDINVTHEVSALFNKAKERLANQGKKIPIVIYYYPIDCNVPKDRSDFLTSCDVPVCYTSHGRAETLKKIPSLADHLQEIPHGVDTRSFFPGTKEEVDRWKRQIFHIDPRTTLVINVNRNSTRKQIQYSLLAFKEFQKKVPNSTMYLHTHVRDQGGDLVRAIKELGFDPTKDVTFPIKFSPSNPVSIETLNAIYNCGDIFLTTHLGEGWGLTITEAMAAGTPVVAPRNTCMTQQLGEDSSRGYLYKCEDLIWIDNSGYRQKGLVPDIVDQMMKVYNSGPKQSNPKVKAALKWVKEHDWNKITKRWVKLFKEANSIETKEIISTEVI